MIKLSFGKYFVMGVTCYLGAMRNWPWQGQLESYRGCRGMPKVGCRRARLGGHPENLETSPLTSRAARRGSHARCLRLREHRRVNTKGQGCSAGVGPWSKQGLRGRRIRVSPDSPQDSDLL